MKKAILSWVPFIIFALVIISLRLFVLQPVRVSGHSMDPTLADNQRLMVLKPGGLSRFDIIVCKEPGNEKKEVVKRLIGMPGDKVAVKDDQLYINDELVEEPFLATYLGLMKEGKLAEEYSYDKNYQRLADSATTFTSPDFEVEVKADHYFLLGDNRLISLDSRRFGQVSKDAIVGKAIFSYWPLDKLGKIE